jgi:hypothetical protein
MARGVIRNLKRMGLHLTRPIARWVCKRLVNTVERVLSKRTPPLPQRVGLLRWGIFEDDEGRVLVHTGDANRHEHTLWTGYLDLTDPDDAAKLGRKLWEMERRSGDTRMWSRMTTT